MINLLTSAGKLTLEDFASLGRWLEPPQVTHQLPTKQPHRKTGVAEARRVARKRRNRK